jgi:uncharacterized protein (TIGR00730 family)
LVKNVARPLLPVSAMALCIFCGSSPGASPAYSAAAASLGRAMARQGIPLIYGGGRIGLMGIVADAALAAGGKVIGIMPRALFAREIAHPGLTELQLVESMHDRKLRMSEQAEGFIALPGGAGTLEEFFEQWTWAQLGIHRKPCGLLNIEGYFDPLLAMIERMVADRFLHTDYAEMLLIDRDVEGLLRRFGGYGPPRAKWSADAPELRA